MSENKSPLEQVLDLFVYAPLGLAITAREELPKLVEKGRERVSGQVTMAKMMGEFTVQQGTKEAAKAVRRATERLAEYGIVPAPSGGAGDAADAAPEADAEPVPVADAEAAVAASAPETVVAVGGPAAESGPSSNGSGGSGSSNGGGVPTVDSLAIPGYDALSASQVVQRLAGLSGEELSAVAKYESATRHRKTILTRISQLQG